MTQQLRIAATVVFFPKFRAVPPEEEIVRDLTVDLFTQLRMFPVSLSIITCTVSTFNNLG